MNTHFVGQLIAEVTQQRRSIQKAKELYQGRLAPDFTPFEFIKIDELGLSRIIAWLLNPRGSHGQKAQFLKCFVEMLEIPWTIDDCEAASVALETSVGADGRIDIIITTRQFALVIENKPFASDQDLQISRYFSYLDRSVWRQSWVIYLTPDGLAPSIASIGVEEFNARRADQRLKLVAYRTQIANWLNICHAACNADRVSTFIDQIRAKLTRTFEGVSDMSEQSELISVITATDDAVFAAMQVANAKNEMQDQLFQKLKAEIGTAASGRGWKLSWQLERKPKSGFSVDFSGTCEFIFGMWFYESNFGAASYGVRSKNTVETKSSPAAIAARQALVVSIGPNRGDSSEEWPWWGDDEADPYMPLARNWNISPEPWVKMRNGQLSKEFVEMADRVFAALKGASLI